MTPYELQEKICEEIPKILHEMLFQVPGEKELKGIKCFKQNLPKREQKIGKGNLMASEEETYYPYCVVRIDSGKIKLVNDSQKVTVILVFGIYNDKKDMQGHTDILNAMQKITGQFVKNPILCGQFRLKTDEDIEWILDEEETYPYYYGAMIMTWETPFWTKEEDIYA